MAITNRDRISKMVDLLVEGLHPFIERELRSTPGQEPLGRRLPGSASYDLAELLRLIDLEWNSVFRNTLSRSARSFAHELRDVRNAFAHNEQFTYSDTFRAIDTASRLLKAISANQAAELEAMAVEVQRVQFTEQSRTLTRDRSQAQLDTKVMSQAGLQKWRDVVMPHRDVQSGNFVQAQFAADLQQIISGTAEAEYGDPREFFRRTHLTRGIQDLLTNAHTRLSGQGGDPVAELQTNFGGGKTHSMIALYHLFGGVDPTDIPIENFLQQAGMSSLPKAKRAVLVGTALNPGEPWTKSDGTEIRTLWGEMAYQLGGKPGYALVESNDRNGTSPGSERIAEVLSKFSPSLILVDEWVAYARQTYGKTDLPGGTFDSNMTFAQALTEAASRVKDCLVVASLPVSERFGSDGRPTMSEADQIEVGGDAGKRALDSLRDFFQRKAVQWSPASAEESFEIVRRRLFEPLTTRETFASRDAVIRAFSQMYSNNHADFPQGASRDEYMRRFQLAYPVHPSLFEVLYEGWGSLERFQRTRGVLRLMAAVIHELWERQDDGLMILPGSIPMDSTRVVEELTRYLEDNWRPIISTDVDGPESLPLQLDRANGSFGRVSATRRVARAVYMGSAPLLHAQHKGLEDRLVKVGVVQPGESPATFGDALRGLADKATHLYSDGSRYWYEIKPSIAREAQQRAQRLEAEPDRVYEEIRGRLREEQRRRGDFARVFAAPATSGDFEDAPEASLVILGPEVAHKAREKQSDALKVANDFLRNHGNGPRINRNALVFLAADRPRLDELMAAVRTYLAWNEILDEYHAKRIELSNFEAQQVESQRKNSADAVARRIPEAYSLMLVPVQPNPAQEIELQEYRLTAQEGLAERASKKLKNEDQLRTQFAGTLLRMELDKVLWKNGPDHVSVRQLWEYFAQHVYLPRLKDESVLHEAVSDGMSLMFWREEGFAYGDAVGDGDRPYRGLRAGPDRRMSPGAVAGGVVIKPAAADKQMAADAEAATQAGTGTVTTGTQTGGTIRDPGPEKETQPRRLTRFYGTKRISPDRLGIGAAEIGDEIVKHLAALDGTDVEIRIDISASRPDGFDESVVRTVTENVNTQKFEGSSGFETE
jgi:predicted AAA+ superfamily ATPase